MRHVLSLIDLVGLLSCVALTAWDNWREGDSFVKAVRSAIRVQLLFVEVRKVAAAFREQGVKLDKSEA